MTLEIIIHYSQTPQKYANKKDNLIINNDISQRESDHKIWQKRKWTSSGSLATALSTTSAVARQRKKRFDFWRCFVHTDDLPGYMYREYMNGAFNSFKS